MPPKKAQRCMAPQINPNTIFQDFFKKNWIFGGPIGQGGFGALYTCAVCENGKPATSFDYVIKVEPHDNGPLFVEISFYRRAAKIEMIEQWVKTKKLKYLGVPKLYGAGCTAFSKMELRFLVMRKFGTDLQKKFVECQRLPPVTVFIIAISLINSLEYLHNHEFVHADIKGANVLLGLENPNHVYLVDYGLAHRYCPNGKHQDYKPDPRTAHDGTIEYTSIDAHTGARPSRRGDIEILAYVLLHWLTSHLPWMDCLNDPKKVQLAKQNFFKDTSKAIATCFQEGSSPPYKLSGETEMKCLFSYVKSLKYDQEPCYNKLRDIFRIGLRASHATEHDDLIFPSSGKKAVCSSATDQVMSVRTPDRTPASVLKTSNKRNRAQAQGSPVSSAKRTNLESPVVTSLKKSGTPRRKKTPSTSSVESSGDPGCDAQVQTSPWMLEQFRIERRRRRQAVRDRQFNQA